MTDTKFKGYLKVILGCMFSGKSTEIVRIVDRLKTIDANIPLIQQELIDNEIVLAEAVQSILRREGIPNPYEMLKDLTRSNEQITAASIQTFISNLDVSSSLKEELLQITPQNYTGI